MISSEQVKELRDTTGISVMQCRKALEDAQGDMEKALTLLKKKGADVAAKKADRTLGAGRIATYVHSSGQTAAMVELSCETDFVSKNEGFYALAYDIAMQIVATNPKYIKAEDITAEEKDKMKEVFMADVDQSKPAEIREKIITGKLDAYFNEQTLMEQPFIKNDELKIKDLISNAVQKFGEKTEVTRFVRYSVATKSTC